MDAKTGEIDLLDELHPVAKTNLLYPDVIINKVKFVNKLHHLVAVRVESITENVRKLCDDLSRLLFARTDKSIDRIQCVE
jgi:hypothetical protein